MINIKASLLERSVVIGLLLLGSQRWASAADNIFKIDHFALQGQTINFQFASSETHYYLLLKGETVSLIETPVAMKLGSNTAAEVLSDSLSPVSPNPDTFYMLRQISLDQPQDTDLDGIDDVWELRFRNPGAALNPNDASEDHNGSGSPDILDYELPMASFSSASSITIAENLKTVEVTMRFSKPFEGEAIVLLGGDAVPGLDFEMPSLVLSNQTARVPVTGNTAAFTIKLLDKALIAPDRHLLFSILEPATDSPAPYGASLQDPVNHTLRITEGDLALYTGLLEFTNRTGFSSHAVRMALRTVPGGGTEAYLDATQSSFFRQGLILPVDIAPGGQPKSFFTPITGEMLDTVLQRNLTWTLQFGAVTNAESTLEAPATLTVIGLSASEQPSISRGVLRLVRINTITP